MSSQSELKIDVTSFACDNHRELVVANANLPLNIIRDNRELQGALQRLSDFLQNTFSNDSVSFQVNASYYIRHTETDDVKFFAGSFLPQDNVDVSLSGEQFIRFRADTFTQTVSRYCNEDFARDKLTWKDKASNWEFHSLNSIIISCQVTVSNNHNFFLYHLTSSTRHGNYGRRKTFRKQKTFAL